MNRALRSGKFGPDKSGRDDDKAETANIMIDRGHMDLSPDFEITHTIQEKSVNQDQNTVGTKIKVVDYDKLIEPKKYLEAWNHPEPFQRKKWREAINKEFGDMKDRKVFKKIKQTDMPKGRRCVKHK